MKKFEITCYHSVNPSYYGYQKMHCFPFTNTFYANDLNDALGVFHNIIETEAYVKVKEANNVIMMVKIVGNQAIFSNGCEQYVFELEEVNK